MKNTSYKNKMNPAINLFSINTKFFIACLISAVFIVSSLPLNALSESSVPESMSPSNSESPKTSPKGSTDLFRDETVYAMLRLDGSFDGNVTSVNFIHPIDNIPEGILLDFGFYDNLLPLSFDAKYTANDAGEILWKFDGKDNLPEGFFYRGEMSDKKLPFSFEIKYLLDNEIIDPKILAGKSGDFEMEITITPNSGLNSYLEENFAVQMQIPLNTRTFSEIKAPGSASILTGKTRILNLTVLPGKSQTFTLEAKVSNFEMDEIRIAITPFSTDIVKQVIPEDINNKIDELAKGVEQIASGGNELHQGLLEFTGSIGHLIDGFNDLSKGQKSFLLGLEEYLSGVKYLSEGHTELSSGLEETAFGGVGLTLAYEDLRNEISAFLDSLEPLLETLAEQEKLLYEQRITIIKEQLNIYDHHLNQYIDVITDISSSSKELSEGLMEISDKNENIQSAMTGLSAGNENYASGMLRFKNESSGLTEGSSMLAGSLSLLSKELSDASIIFKDLVPQSNSSKPLSFSDNKTKVNSVNFIVSIPSIKMFAPLDLDPVETPGKTFWQRFLDLFRKNR